MKLVKKILTMKTYPFKLKFDVARNASQAIEMLDKICNSPSLSLMQRPTFLKLILVNILN